MPQGVSFISNLTLYALSVSSGQVNLCNIRDPITAKGKAPRTHIQLMVSVRNLPRSRKNKPTATPQARGEKRNCRIDSPKNMDSV
jgi:hypothetical protein